MVKRQRYEFIKDDTSNLKKLGYVVEPPTTSLEEFINREFPNLDLLSLLEAVEKSFTPTTKLPLSRTISIKNVPASLRVKYFNKATNEDDELVFDREFTKSGKSIIINHHFCVIPKEYRDKGVIRKVFQESLQQYTNMGARRILVHAGFSGGGYVWARYGFVAVRQKEVEKILEEARKHLSAVDFEPVEHIFRKYYKDSPRGKAFPIILWAELNGMKDVLLGSNWHGELNLKNKEQFSNFRDYVFRS